MESLFPVGSTIYYVFGVAFMFFLGISGGNYATSLVYRLPRGLKIANDPPYCECDKQMYLGVRDLFPFFSWLANKGQCRFCDIKIPAIYTAIEFLSGFLFVTTWLTYGIGEQFILILAIDIFLMIQAAIYFNDKKIINIVLVAIVACSAVYRTLQDGTIYGFVQSGYFALILAIIIWGVEMLLRKRKLPFPHYAIFLFVGAIALPKDEIIAYFIVAFIVAMISFGAKCLSPKFKDAAWIFGVTASVMMALSHG
jgi:leader peptidase (prepilin peptidase) / N-methyltransferase